MHFALLLAVSLAQWSTNGPKNGISTHLTASAGPRPRLYLQAYVTTSGAGIYRSDDGGESWQRKAYPCADICVALAVDPRNPDRVYSADFHYGGFNPEYSSRIESSVDGGASWTSRLTRLGTKTCSLTVDLAGSVYASFGDILTLYRSEDGGETFTGFPVVFEGALLATAADGALLAARFGNVFVSRDRGENWINTAPVPVSCAPVAIAPDRRDPLRWYVASECGEVARTDDGGSSWAPATNPGGPVAGITTDASGVVYVSTGPRVPSPVAGRVLTSMDGGSTWVDLGGPAAGGIGEVVVSDDGGHIDVATSSGVYRLDLRRPQSLSPR